MILNHKKSDLYQTYGKRFLDICCAIAAIAVFCWLYVIIAILVRICLGRPVIFKQIRPGRIDPRTGKETQFYLYKFRTMTDERDPDGNLLPDDVRLTKFGKWLRSTSLDELPEAYNILKGDMSVVGPRPLLVEYLPLYNGKQHHRHDVRPGLSGWAQVNGRNAITWEEKFDLDIWYVAHISFLLDLKIVIKSVSIAIRRKGISSETCETMEKFSGEREIHNV